MLVVELVAHVLVLVLVVVVLRVAATCCCCCRRWQTGKYVMIKKYATIKITMGHHRLALAGSL